jgi:hypothetical protein
MPDQLHLSFWLKRSAEDAVLSQFEELLRRFPFSHLRPGIGALCIYAIDYSEPTLVEHAFTEEVDAGAVLEMCREFESADCAYVVEGWWELWRYQQDWQLKPAPVTLTCFGPEFDNEMGDHLRVVLGAEYDFLPQPGVPQGAQKAQSNLAGLVRLAREMSAALPVERMSLWSDSGENFADRFDEALAE